MLRSLLNTLFVISACLLAGCGTYQLGTGNAPEFKSVYIAPVRNAAAMPQAAALYSKEIREAFVRDGRLELAASPEAADAVLEVSLDTYERESTSALPDDTRLARKFDLNVRATATLRETRSGRELIKNRALTATRQIFTTSQPTGEISRQQQAEFNTQPLLARKLGEEVVHLVLDTW